MTMNDDSTAKIIATITDKDIRDLFVMGALSTTEGKSYSKDVAEAVFDLWLGRKVFLGRTER